MPEFGEPALFELQEVRDLTGYRIRKCLTYKKDQIISGSDQSTTGCIIYRGVEAYLNYLEAYYLRNGKVDGKAAQYWTAIRKRGGVDTDYDPQYGYEQGSRLGKILRFYIGRRNFIQYPPRTSLRIHRRGYALGRPDALESYGSVAHNQIYSGRIQLLG